MPRLFQMFVASSAISLAACTSLASTAESPQAVVSQRLEQYAEHLQRQDSAAIAAMFEPSGFMAHQGQPPIVGRAAIQAFLESFAGYKVLAHKMLVTSAVGEVGTVEQTGTYSQSVLTPEGRKLDVAGTFTALWQHEQGGQWLIQSMRTAPQGGG